MANYRKGERPPYYRIMADCLVLLNSIKFFDYRVQRRHADEMERLTRKLKKAIEKPDVSPKGNAG
jgi:hypothetical protein